MPRLMRHFLWFAVFTRAILRMTAQPMELDTAFAPRVDSGESVVASVKYAAAPGGQLIVFGLPDRFYVDDVRAKHALARLLPNGTVDASFLPQLDSSVDEIVWDAIALSDGRILVSTFATNGTQKWSRVLRLLPGGQVDPTFAPSTYSLSSAATGTPNLALTSDGRIFVWGNLGSGHRFVRLLADGSVDATFQEPTFPNGVYGPQVVVSLAVAPDGGLDVVMNTASSKFFGYGLARIKPTGEIDRPFTPPNVFEGAHVVARQPDNQMLLLVFPESGAQLQRLNGNGTIDATFAAQLPAGYSPDSAILLPDGRIAVQAHTAVAHVDYVSSVFVLQPNGALQVDGRTLAGAQRFQSLRGVSSDGRIVINQGLLARIIVETSPPYARVAMEEPVIALLDPSAGTVSAWPTAIDSSARAAVARLSLDAAGRVLVEGNFKRIAGVRRNGYARFNVEGTLDPNCVPVAATPLLHLPDGRIIAKRTTLSAPDSDGFRDYVTAVVRLTAEGTVDPTFVPATGVDLLNATWLDVAADGRILVVENPTVQGGAARLIWLAPDGRLSSQLAAKFPTEVYAPSIPPQSKVWAAASLPDGKLLFGMLQEINGVSTRAPIRLNADGSTDTSYRPDTTAVPTPVYSIPLRDGRAYVVRDPYGHDGHDPLPALGLNADGSADTFVPRALVYGLPLGDGTYLYQFKRFFADGTPDANFTFPFPPGYDENYGMPTSAVRAPDGSLWVGVTIYAYSGLPEEQRHGSLLRLVPAAFEGFTVPPLSQAVTSGFDATFHADLATTKPATYQWTHNGAAIAAANESTLRVPMADSSAAGEYRLIATVGDKTYTSAAATLTVRPNDTRLVNFSARSAVARGFPPQIGGFVLRGASARRVLLRAIGRGLPVDNPGFETLPAPELTLHAGPDVLARDVGGALAPTIVAAGQSLGAFAVRTEFPAGEPTHDSALLLPLAAGAYTAQAGSADGRAGINLFEFYDADPANPDAAVVNVSVRGRAAPGDDALIAGFVVGGHGALRVLIRGIGPGLEPYGVKGVVANPRLTLFRESEPIAANDDWSDQADAADVVSAVARTGAFALPSGSRDSALLVTLPPGVYTVHGRDADGGAGELMIELYVIE